MKTYQIHLIRNGRTDDSTSGRYIGHTDAILSPEGVAELHRLKEQADYPYVEAVFTSPLKRCTQTAHAIYPEREAIVMRELIEYDFGEYEGKTPEQLKIAEGMMKTNVTNAAIVTHGGVIMTILAAFGIPELPMPEWRTPSGCGYTVRITPSIWMRGQKAEVIAEIPTFPQEEDLPDLSTEAFYVDLEELRQEEHDA